MTNPSEALSSTKQPPLTPKQKARCRAMWESGEFTLQQIADELSRNLSVIKRALRGVEKGKAAAATERRVKEEMAKQAAEEAALTIARAKETKEEHYRMSAGIAKLVWNEILAAARDKRPVSTAQPNIKSLEAAMSVLQRARMERFAVLGLDKEDIENEDLPDLSVSELTQEQIEEIRNRNEDDLDDLPIEEIDATGDGDDVVVEGDDEAS